MDITVGFIIYLYYKINDETAEMFDLNAQNIAKFLMNLTENSHTSTDEQFKLSSYSVEIPSIFGENNS